MLRRHVRDLEPREVAELERRDDHADPGGEPHRHGVGDELDEAAEAHDAESQEQRPRPRARIERGARPGES
jgi:hypothetical protein